jgi:hypothetical protein
VNWLASAFLFSLVLVPLLGALVDMIPASRAIGGVVFPLPDDHRTQEDFTVLVPIYGNIKYLENIAYLRDYGRRVVLTTTTNETPEFNRELHRIAQENDFRIFTADAAGPRNGGRSTGGTIRDRIVRAASERYVTSEYIVCIDADTTTSTPIGEIVGALVANNLDLASVRLVPSNTDRLLGKLQAHEYRMVMRLRRILPWVCSGAFHLGRTAAHREIMKRHSLFFQGNDVELGLLGYEMGYRVGHLAIEVPTAVPDRVRPWLKQRIAWSGGEFRLFMANPQIARQHPWYFLYGGVVVILLVPLRWWNIVDPGWDLVTVFVIYWTILALVNWRHRDWALFVYPLYGMFNSLVLTPIGIISYLWMAIPEGNWGWIRLSVHRTRRRQDRTRAAALR